MEQFLQKVLFLLFSMMSKYKSQTNYIFLIYPSKVKDKCYFCSDKPTKIHYERNQDTS